MTRHAEYLQLGGTPEARAARWREFLLAPLDGETLAWLRKRVASQRALGDARFAAMVSLTLNRPAAYRPPGRPVRER